MSRLLIKNLPTHTTPSTLQAHFTQPTAPPLTITDVKVALKRDGSSRRFGFVGLKSEEEAKKAREWFDKTFVGNCRVRVEIVDVSRVPF